MNAVLDFLFGWVVDLLYQGVIYVCMAIMVLVKSILTLIFDIANITFFTDTTINDLKTRVYIIIGVLMLFKITISCIQYLVNPDKAEDKENGFGGIIKRTIISVLLLALVPTIFSFAKYAQNAIVEALPKVILNQQENVDIDEIGESIAYTTTLGFFGYSSETCNNGSIGGLSGGSSNSTFSSTDDILANVKLIATDRCNNENRYKFNWLLCFPASIFLVLILVSMTIDVGIRVIKFGFLELIAPVPIASYIDPKTSKKSFDSWVHNSISVYVDLFIRLGVIYLILYLFLLLIPSFQSSFVLNDGTKLSWGRSMLVNVAIIISLFMFAKNAPKFICDVLGIKDSGSLKDMFKRAGGLAGTGLGALRTGYSNYKTQRARLAGKDVKGVKNVANSLRSAIAGAGSALGRGGFSSLRGKGFKDSFNSASRAINSRDQRNSRLDNLYSTDVPKYNPDGTRNEKYYGRLDYAKDKFNTAMGIPSSPGYTKFVYDKIDQIAQAAAAEKSFGATKMLETPNDYWIKASDGHRYTIATARSYSDIKVGTVTTKPNGTVGEWTVEDQANAQQIQQEVEKATSYVKTAHLYAKDDPTATMNHQKTILAIENNRDVFNDPSIVDTIVSSSKKLKEKTEKDPKLFHDAEFGRRMCNIKGIDDLLTILNMKPTLGGKIDTSKEAAEDYAKAVEFTKSLFEDIRTQKYATAQAAEEREKKTQQAKKDK